MEKILKVDENDNVIGEEDKEVCHKGEGILHRAYLLIIMNSNNQILLTKRSSKKMLWDGFWDGSVASHPHKGESYEEAAKKRCKEELGADCKPKYLFKFMYAVPYKDVGSERELCAVLVAKGVDEVKPDPDEISEHKFVSMEELKEDIKKNKDIYCPWFLIALEKLPEKL